MFASLKGFDGDLGVPMVRSDDADDFDVFVIEDFAIVFNRFGFPFADSIVVAGSFSVVGINIADSDDIAEAVVVVSITGAHATHSDATDLHSILRSCRVDLRRPGPIGDRSQCGGGLCGAF